MTLLEKALELKIKTFGQNSVELCYTYILFARTYMSQNKYDKAIEYSEKAIK